MTALLGAPDQTQFIGRRDHALLLLALQSGMRVSELVGLRRGDVVFDVRSHVRCIGKGRKERTTPLTKMTASVIRRLLAERDVTPDSPLFANTHGSGPLTRSAVSKLVARRTRTASECCPSLGLKEVTPHVLRHTAAMRLLQSGSDISTIPLWLEHQSIETTQIYVHADLALKEQALDCTTPVGKAPGRYRPSDKLLAMLEAL